mgnify:CR=1 FL=1
MHAYSMQEHGLIISVHAITPSHGQTPCTPAATFESFIVETVILEAQSAFLGSSYVPKVANSVKHVLHYNKNFIMPYDSKVQIAGRGALG